MKTKDYLLKLDQESKIIMYYYGYTIEKRKFEEVSDHMYTYFLWIIYQTDNNCQEILKYNVNELFYKRSMIFLAAEQIISEIKYMYNISARFDSMIEDSSLFQFLDPILDTTKPPCLENILKAILEDAKKRKFRFIDYLPYEELIEELDGIIDGYQQNLGEGREENSLKSKLRKYFKAKIAPHLKR